MIIPGTVRLVHRESWGIWPIKREHSFNGKMNVQTGYCLVCPRCTKVWAELSLDDDPYLWPRSQFCEDCFPPEDYEWCPVPGSVLFEEGWGVIDDSLLAALPPALIEREFKIHLRAYSL